MHAYNFSVEQFRIISHQNVVASFLVMYMHACIVK